MKECKGLDLAVKLREREISEERSDENNVEFIELEKGVEKGIIKSDAEKEEEVRSVGQDVPYEELGAYVYEEDETPSEEIDDTVALFEEIDASFDPRDPISIENTAAATREHLDEFLLCKSINADILASMLSARDLFRNIDKFQELRSYSVNMNNLARRLDRRFIRTHFGELLNRGVKPQILVNKLFYRIHPDGELEIIAKDGDRELLRQNFERFATKDNACNLAEVAFDGCIKDITTFRKLFEFGVDAETLCSLAPICDEVEIVRPFLVALKEFGLSPETIFDEMTTSGHKEEYAEQIMEDPEAWEKELGISRNDFAEIYIHSEIRMHYFDEVLRGLSNAGLTNSIFSVLSRDELMDRIMPSYDYDISYFLEKFGEYNGSLDMLEARIMGDGFSYDSFDDVRFALEFLSLGRGKSVNKEKLTEVINSEWFHEGDNDVRNEALEIITKAST